MPAPFGAGLDLVKITVKARELRPQERRRAVLTLAVDTSGSMHHAESLNLMRQSLRTLVGSLRPADQVALIAYSSHAYVVLPHTPAREVTRLSEALDTLVARGGTNVEGGLDLAYRLADEVLQPKAVNRVILCSDGVANVGARNPEKILAKVKAYARRGIYLSVVGFGKKRYDDRFLETISREGNGNYSYVSQLAEARAIFEEDLPATLQVLAEDAKIQVEFDPEVVSHYRLLGYEKRDIADKDFRNDKVDAAEVGPGSTVTALYEIERHRGSYGALGKVFVRYRDTATRRIEEQEFPLRPGIVAPDVDAADAAILLTACAAETAELLRDSYWARDGSFARVLDLLLNLPPEVRARDAWRELTEVVLRAQALTVQKLAAEGRRQ
jgi:Ca-activated chloride channel family protein